MRNKHRLFFDIFIIFLFGFLIYSINRNLQSFSYLIVGFSFFLFLFSFIKSSVDIKIEKSDFKYLEQDYLNALKNSSAIAKFNRNFEINYTNRLFCQLILYSKNNCIGKKLDDFLIKQDDVKNEICETLRLGQSWEGVLNMNISYGKQIYVKCSIVPIKNSINSNIEYLFIGNDLTELMIAKKTIQNANYVESHTRLPNRMQLIKEILEFRGKQNLTLFVLNIDSFQAINSMYGNNFGDKVLVVVAKWLSNNLPVKNSKLYKFESDVYAILIPFDYKRDKLNEYLDYLSEKIAKEGLYCLGIDINITFTIGVAQGKKNLLKLSSIAYKEAKKVERAYLVYDHKSEKEKEYLDNIKMINILKKSLETDKIIPYYQPIMEVKRQKIEKYETLMRIKKENNSVYLPYEFLEIAKHSKLYTSISKMLIKKAFENFNGLSVEFSVNLSFLDISNPDTLDFILKILSKYNIGSWVVFEILESEGINNYDMVFNFIETVKSFGAKIAIDDFGSGYSNFERIVRLQPDYIKIDGSLIKNLDKNDDMKIISQTIVDFAQKLGVKTIAEYVHSKNILDIVTEMGIDYAQGYYIGEPSPILISKPRYF